MNFDILKLPKNYVYVIMELNDIFEGVSEEEKKILF